MEKIAIIGLGYIGLPLSLQFACSGTMVTGIDIDPEKVEALNAGKTYIKHVPGTAIQKVLTSGRFTASTDFDRVREVEAIIVCVPTPLTKTREPDLSYVLDTGRAIAPHLRRGTVVVLESTTYPGTTDEDFRAVLEQGSGMKAGEAFHLAFSPEREDPGNPESKVAKIPKIVGGYTPGCLEKAVALYSRAVETVVPVSSCKTAEATKLLENIFRSVNIALANEIALMCSHMNIDVWEVIKAASSKPFGFMAFYPGPGLGGHCIPIDPLYLEWKSKIDGFESRFIGLADKINSGMPRFVATRAMELLNEQGKAMRGSRVHILGVTYKKDIGDSRESPAIEVIKLLTGLGAHVTYSDPYVPSLRLEGRSMSAIDPSPEVVRACDMVIIVTNHSAFNYAEIVKDAPLVFDTRNATDGIKASNLVRL